MKSLQALKKDLEFNKTLINIIGVMKEVALVQYRLLEKQRQKFVELKDMVMEFFNALDFSLVNSQYVNPRSDKLGIVIITSDKGFMGGLNLRVIHSALGQNAGADKAEIIVVGRKGADSIYALNKDCKLFRESDFSSRYDLAVKLKDYLIEGIKAGSFGRLVFFYASSISFMSQEVKNINILPIEGLIKESIVPRKGERHGIVESSLEHIIEYLVESWMFYELVEILEDGKLAEYSARTIQLERSHQELTRRRRQIKFQYFKVHHNQIDKSMRETFSASLIRKRK